MKHQYIVSRIAILSGLVACAVAACTAPPGSSSSAELGQSNTRSADGASQASQTAPNNSGRSDASSASSWNQGAMAVTANPLATQAAQDMLQAGGHAVDAAIAAHLVLGLVEPQSSGIGGGGFMLVFENHSDALTFLDGREVAPMGAKADMFMQDGEVMNFLTAWQSGKAIGVPGAISLYKLAHDKYGRLPWEKLFAPAIQLAEEGFEVSPRLANFLPRMASISRLDENPGSAEYFYPNGTPLAAGTKRDNPAYAQTLRKIADQGPAAFYSGEIAKSIVAAARMAPEPGTLNLADLAQYNAVERQAICGTPTLSGKYKICTATPPSSGAMQIMIAQLYTSLRQQYQEQYQDYPERAFVDAQRLAYADRDHYFGDPDHIVVPVEALIKPAYLKHRAKHPTPPADTPEHGDPLAFVPAEHLPVSSLNWSTDTTIEASGTTHLSIVDTQGNAVSFTATVEAPFGSARWAHGFLLNNEMTDFAREVPANGDLPANAVGPGRRPRSSMSPTMVFDEANQLRMVTGSPGGNSIPAYVAKSILGVLEWGLSAQAAIDHPNIVARGKQVRVEIGEEEGSQIAASLRALNYDIKEREGENSGLSIIVVSDDGLEGAADKRREGTVAYIPPL